MAHTNTTANYNLTQFIGTDIPNPLTDYNGDMETIDTTMHNIAESTIDNADDISALDTRLTTAEGDIDAVETRATNLESSMSTAESDIDTLQSTLTTAVGNISTLTTKIGTAEDDIDALETRMTTAESDINALEAQNGSAVLTTDAQTLSGAINELDTEVGTKTRLYETTGSTATNSYGNAFLSEPDNTNSWRLISAHVTGDTVYILIPYNSNTVHVIRDDQSNTVQTETSITYVAYWIMV